MKRNVIKAEKIAKIQRDNFKSTDEYSELVKAIAENLVCDTDEVANVYFDAEDVKGFNSAAKESVLRMPALSGIVKDINTHLENRTVRAIEAESERDPALVWNVVRAKDGKQAVTEYRIAGFETKRYRAPERAKPAAKNDKAKA